jgi:uncharacterized membrane protein YeaQ/YmgE (transglycosylase-associated protein family)
MALPWLPRRGAEITVYVWCAIGAVVGWLFGVVTPVPGKVLRLEEVAVGMFGAVIGAEVLQNVFTSGPAATGITPVGLFAAVVGAVLLLAVLKVMRKAVGPMRSGKSPSARRR